MAVVPVAGAVTPGQQLTPNQNVFAPATMFGDKWGANGGDQVPVGTVKPIAAAICNGEFAANYLPPSPPLRSVLASENNSALSGQALVSSVATGGSNAG